MVTSFDDAQIGVEVDDVEVSGRVTQDNSDKIMCVQFTAPRASLLDADAGAKCFWVGDVRFASVPIVRSNAGSGVDQAVVKVNRACRGSGACKMLCPRKGRRCGGRRPRV
jgi:hypothetical protein